MMYICFNIIFCPIAIMAYVPSRLTELCVF